MPRARAERGGIDLRRLPVIRVRRLGRQRADAQSWHPQFAQIKPIKHPVIDLELSHKGRTRLEDIAHEALHLALPGLPEDSVRLAARYQALVLWHLGYRADDEAINEEWALPGPNEPHS